jgi:peroxiredoxin
LILTKQEKGCVFQMAHLQPGTALLDFTLPATDGQTYTASAVLKIARALIVVFTCNHCPYAQAWQDRLTQIVHDYDPQGVHMLAISSNDAVRYPADSFEKMAEYAQQKRFVFPYLYDEDQTVARAYGAERTPELFIFDAAGVLCYHGAPDDNYDDELAVKHHYAREALDDILAGRVVRMPETPPVGCSIKWKV